MATEIVLVDFTADELREIRDCIAWIIDQSVPEDEFHDRLFTLYCKICEELRF